MEGLISGAAAAVFPALDRVLLDSAGSIDVEALRSTTSTVADLMGTRRGPASAVYVAWDTHGRCRYVGSVRRVKDRAAVRSRIGEHLRRPERRGMWYAITVLPLLVDLEIEVVHECEGRVARRLKPVDGTAHPIPQMDRSLDDLISGRNVITAS
jgi:hypothetical protein